MKRKVGGPASTALHISVILASSMIQKMVECISSELATACTLDGVQTRQQQPQQQQQQQHSELAAKKLASSKQG